MKGGGGDFMCNLLREHCPKLVKFESLGGIPADEYARLLQFYGTRVKTAVLQNLVGYPTLCRQVLEACPNLKFPKYVIKSYPKDDLSLVESRLIGSLLYKDLLLIRKAFGWTP